MEGKMCCSLFKVLNWAETEGFGLKIAGKKCIFFVAAPDYNKSILIDTYLDCIQHFDGHSHMLNVHPYIDDVCITSTAFIFNYLSLCASAFDLSVRNMWHN